MNVALWPIDDRQRVDPRAEAGYFYGWTSPVVCVAGTLPLHGEDDTEHILKHCNEIESLSRVISLCGSPPVILGVWRSPEGLQPGCPNLTFFDKRLSGLRVVTYRRPNLGKLEIHALNANIPTSARAPDLPQDKMKLYLSNRVPASYFSHDFTRPVRRTPAGFDQKVLNQMNYGQLFEQAILSTAPQALLPLRDGVTQFGSAFVRLAAHRRTTLSRTQSKFLSIAHAIFRFARIHSVVCKQAGTRLSQVIALPRSFPIHTYDGGIVSLRATTEYMAFYNCMWLLLNDMIIGWAFGAFMRENATLISHVVEYWIRRYLVYDLHRTLLWLDSWPAGLKLNTELSQFLCRWLLGAVFAWDKILDVLILPHTEVILWACGGLGCFGATLTVALLADLLAVLTTHTYVCYTALRAVYALQLGVLGSLWNLFRGKRYNVLRKRVDSSVYEVDQLLLGTILFTLVTFLFPTTLTYYALFALLRLGLLIMHALSEVLLVLINEFPLFALLLRAKDPFRLPGGIANVLDEHKERSHLQSEVISLRTVFAHYGTFWSRFSTHYHPSKLLQRFVASDPLTHFAERSNTTM